MKEESGDLRCVPFRREQSPTLGRLFKAWAAAKLEPDWHSEINKNATAQYGGFVNMAGLIGATEKALAKHHLIVNQTFLHDGDPAPLLLVTEIGHGESGEFIRSILPVPRGGKIHEQKSAITYMRRAGYEALLGLAPADPKSDDDGDAANNARRPADDPSEWRRVELVAKQKIGAAKTKDELMALVARVQAKFDTGELPQPAVDRLLTAADERSKTLPKG
jgi:hypothetical protein